MEGEFDASLFGDGEDGLHEVGVRCPDVVGGVLAIERWFFDNKGWNTIGSVTGRNLAECERRFFEAWLPAQPVISASKSGSGQRGGGGWPFGARA